MAKALGGNALLVGPVVKLARQKIITATVIDILGDLCSVRLSGKGALLHALHYIGPAPKVGDTVHVNYQSGVPIVVTSNNTFTSDVEAIVSQKLADQNALVPVVPSPAGTDLPVESLTISSPDVTVDDIIEIRFTGATVEDGADGLVLVTVDPPNPSHEHVLARWNGAEGQDTFELPDVWNEVEDMTINGLEEDPLAYSLSSDGTQLLLDNVLPTDMAVVAHGLIAIL